MSPDDRKELIQDIAEAMRSSAPVLSDEELHWVRLAIKKEAQSVALRQAIIEKTFTGLIWGAIVGAGSVFMGWLSQHGFKP